MSNDIIEGLQKIRDQVFERLLVNPDYRALRAIDKTINDIIAIGEMPAARSNGQNHTNGQNYAAARKEQEDQQSIAELSFAQNRPTTPKLNTAPLFPAHRVA
eukprot:gene7287-7357_t